MSGLERISDKLKKLNVSSLMKEGIISYKLLILGLLGVTMLIIGSYMDVGTSINPAPEINNKENRKEPTMVYKNYEDALESKLSLLLSNVKGAGNVNVSITLENNGIQEHAKNTVKESRTIQEKDNGGGIRTTTEVKESAQILVSKDNGIDRPVMVRETKPAIKGVLIIAEGATDSIVKANLIKAVEAGLGVPPYKITVVPQRK